MTPRYRSDRNHRKIGNKSGISESRGGGETDCPSRAHPARVEGRGPLTGGANTPIMQAFENLSS